MKMKRSQLLWIYAVTAGVFFLLDLVWIGVVAKDFYAGTIGGLLRDSVNWPAALIFYFLYIGGIVLFVLVPAIRANTSIRRTAGMGGLLGLLAYGTFDLTALALLEGWPVIVTAVDMAWGATLTGGAAGGSLWIARNFLKTDGWPGGRNQKENNDG